MEEVVFFTSDTGKTQQNTSSTEQIATATDLQTGAHVSTFKKTSSPRHGFVATSSRLYALQSQQAYLLTYNHDKEASCQRIILPEKLSCLCVSPMETYLVAGGETGRMLIWELASGNLVFEQDTHYQGITSLEFTQDEAFLFTGGDDARVMGWRVLDLITAEDTIQPVYTFSEHTLPICDVKVGYGSSLEARVYTASEDQTVRVWDVRTGQCLTTFILPVKISSMCVDPAERVIYVGLVNGNVQMVQLYQADPRTGLLGSRGGAKQILTIEGDADLTGNHTSAVTAMDLSFDASLLVTGDGSGGVYVWDIASKQVTKKLKQHKGAISSVVTMVREKQVSDGPLLPMFKRIKDVEALKRHDLNLTIPEMAVQDGSEDMLSEVRRVVAAAQSFGGEDNVSALQAANQQLSNELNTVYDHYNSLRGQHDQLWQLYCANSSAT